MTEATTVDVAKEILGATPPVTPVPATPAPAPLEPTRDAFGNLLAAIQNPEGKQKYPTVEAALIGASHAQEHIKRLEEENAALREATTRSATAEELLQRLGNQGGQTQATPAKPEDVRKLVKEQLDEERAQTVQQRNRQEVLDALTKRFGDKLNEAVAARAQELGMTLQQFGTLAASSPKAVLGFFPETKPAPTVKSTVNPMALTPDEGAVMPTKDLIWGSTDQEVQAYWAQLRTEAERKLGVT